MDKTKLNWTETQFSENLELVFEILIDNWLQDVKDGNLKLVPKSIKKAKEIIIKTSKELMVIPPHNKRKDWEIYFVLMKKMSILVDEKVVEELVDKLLMNKNEVIELAMMAEWDN